MNGGAYLVVARENVAGTTEAHWRAAAGRACYSLMLECRDALERWGFTVIKRDVHVFVRFRFQLVPDLDLKNIGNTLAILHELRGRADYKLQRHMFFASDARARYAIAEAASAIAL